MRLRLRRILDTLDACWDAAGGGGWGGGAGQQAHLACTFAATATLVDAGLVERWMMERDGLQKRQRLYATLLSLKSENGGFRLHREGEVDVRRVGAPTAPDGLRHKGWVLSLRAFNGTMSNEAH